MDRGEAPLRQTEHGHQPVHAVQPEPHAEQLEREEVLLGLPEGHAASRRASASRCSSSLRRSSSTDLGGRLRHEALVGQLALGALDLLAEPLDPLLDPGPRLGGVERVARQDLDAASGHRHRGEHLAVRGRAGPLEARKPRDLLVDIVVALGGEPAEHGRARLRVDLVAVASQRRDGLDQPCDGRLRVVVEVSRVGDRPVRHRQQPALRTWQQRPDLLGHERHHRMEQSQVAERPQQHRRDRLVVLLVEPRLRELEIPIG